jgi:hypothetical protein
VGLTGFDEGELERLLALADDDTANAETEDEAPELPEEPVTRPGDLWILGNHRLLCGDSTRVEDVRRLMRDERASLFATDPPYLVDYDGSNHPTRNKIPWAGGQRPTR